MTIYIPINISVLQEDSNEIREFFATFSAALSNSRTFRYRI